MKFESWEALSILIKFPSIVYTKHNFKKSIFKSADHLINRPIFFGSSLPRFTKYPRSKHMFISSLLGETEKGCKLKVS